MGEALQIRGIQPLAWGTETISGYVNESSSEDASTQEMQIEDETGDVITDISGFGIKYDTSLEVIPKATVTVPPEPADVFTYGSKKIRIGTITRKRIKKDVEKWTIKGVRFPGVALT